MKSLMPAGQPVDTAGLQCLIRPCVTAKNAVKSLRRHRISESDDRAGMALSRHVNAAKSSALVGRLSKIYRSKETKYEGSSGARHRSHIIGRHMP